MAQETEDGLWSLAASGAVDGSFVVIVSGCCCESAHATMARALDARVGIGTSLGIDEFLEKKSALKDPTVLQPFICKHQRFATALNFEIAVSNRLTVAPAVPNRSKKSNQRSPTARQLRCSTALDNGAPTVP